MSKKLSERNKGVVWCICGILLIILSIRIYSVSWQFILIFIPILALFIFKIPIGEGKYLKILRYIDYFFNAYRGYSIKEDLMKIFIVTVIGALLTTAIFFSIPGITLIVSILVSLVTILVVLKNLSLKRTNFLIETLIYLLMIPIVVMANKESVDNGLSLAVTFGTIYFALDRIFSIGDKAMKLIRENSILYYIDEDIQELKECRNLMFSNSYFNNKGYKEIELVRQIVFEWKINNYVDFNELFKKYEESNYKQYLVLVGTLKYYLKFEDEKFVDLIDERINYLNLLFEKSKQYPQAINFVPFYLEFIDVLEYQSETNNSTLIVELITDIPVALSLYYQKIYEKNLKIKNNTNKQLQKMKKSSNKRRNLGKQKNRI